MYNEATHMFEYVAYQWLLRQNDGMTLEVSGFNRDRDGQLANAASFAAADFCIAQGMPEGAAYTTGDRAAQYAAEVIFASLARIGQWPPQDFDPDAFIEATKQVAIESGAIPHPSG
jgi:saccharopine dehydrogenase-like NADP-dependent oxidoreductase